MEKINLFQKVVLNTIIQIVAKAVTIIFGLLVTIILTSYLGAEGFGEYMYVIALIIIFGSIADWGTHTIGTREAAKEKKHLGRVLANVFFVRLLLSLIASILMIISSFFLSLKVENSLILHWAIILASLVLILNTLKSSLLIVYQIKLQLVKQALIDIIISVSIFFLSFYFVTLHLGLIFLISALVFANAVGIIVSFLMAKKIVKFDWRIEKNFIKNLLKESFPMGAILLMFTIDNKIDAVMLGLIKGSGAVGIYAAAYRIYDVLILGAAYFMFSLFPVISRYSDLFKWKNRIKKIYQKSFDIIFMLGLSALLIVWLLAPLLIKVLTQGQFSEFNDSVLVLKILGIALFFAYLNHLTGYTIVALGEQRRYFYIALLSLVFNVIANVWIIPRYSYYGAAIVTILTEALVLIITSIFIFLLLKIIPLPWHFPLTLMELIRRRKRIF